MLAFTARPEIPTNPLTGRTATVADTAQAASAQLRGQHVTIAADPTRYLSDGTPSVRITGPHKGITINVACRLSDLILA